MNPLYLRSYALVFREGRAIQEPGSRGSEDKRVQDTVR